MNENYATLAAWGDWQIGVPPGFVGVFAGRGGRQQHGNYPDDCKYFLVPANEYHRDPPFVIDEDRHIEVEDFTQYIRRSECPTCKLQTQGVG